VNRDVCNELNRTSFLSNSSVLISFFNVVYILIIVCPYMYKRYCVHGRVLVFWSTLPDTLWGRRMSISVRVVVLRSYKQAEQKKRQLYAETFRSAI